MNNDELKKKFIKIIRQGFADADCRNPYTHVPYPYFDSQIFCIADALIAAGIGDVKEAEHRAKTLERAFRDFLAEYLTAVNEANSYDCGIPEMFGRYANMLPYEDKVTNLLNEYLQQAEKELAEERKEP